MNMNRRSFLTGVATILVSAPLGAIPIARIVPLASCNVLDGGGIDLGLASQWKISWGEEVRLYTFPQPPRMRQS